MTYFLSLPPRPELKFAIHTCRALSAERFKLTRFYAIIILVIYMRADHALLGFALSAVRID